MKATISNSIKPRFELIQVFRGVAALLVVLFHCSASTKEYFNSGFFYGIFSKGWMGVDFFFVLSGFIITYVHYSDLTGKGDLVSFFKKRFIRVYPLYWIIATITLVFYLFTGKAVNAADHVNLSYWQQCSYYINCFLLIPQNEQLFVRVAWSLYYEIFFYIIFGLCIIGGFKTAKKLFFIWAASILIAGIAGVNTNLYFIHFITSPFIIEFLMGCLVAYLFRNKKISFSYKTFIYTTIGIISLFILNNFFHHEITKGDFISVLLMGSTFSVIVYTAAKIDSTRNVRFQTPKSLLLLGNASYSLYLIHVLPIAVVFKTCYKVFTSHHILPSNILLNILGISAAGIAVMCGILVHLYIEKPLLKYLNRIYLSNRLSIAS